MMINQDMIHMTAKELKRLHLLRKVLEHQLFQAEAAGMLNLSSRQARRIIRRIELEGDTGVVHRLRGRISNHRTSQKIKDKALELYKMRYSDFGPTLASEKLEELHKIAISRQTLSRWLKEAGLLPSLCRKSSHHFWRERKACFGQMVQMDGSHHDWLETRGPKMVLMALIDDATNTVFARFYSHEGTLPAMDLLYRYICLWGIPQSIYLDKHTTYKSNAKPDLKEDFKGKKHQSQFERACEELAVTVIHAHSPQAKGRVERLFGVFQDRLIKELRLHAINTREEANHLLKTYLPKHNKRFKRQAHNPEDLHRKGFSPLKIKEALSVRHERSVKPDSTIRYKGKIYLLKKPPQGVVIAQTGLGGKLTLSKDQKHLSYREVQEAPKAVLKGIPRPKAVKRITPAPQDHPWRKSFQRHMLLKRGEKLNFEDFTSIRTHLKPDVSIGHKTGHF